MSGWNLSTCMFTSSVSPTLIGNHPTSESNFLLGETKTASNSRGGVNDKRNRSTRRDITL